MKKIKNAIELRRAVAAGTHEFRVYLRYGLVSRKTITACAGGRFRIVNHIDDSVQRLTGRQLHSHSIVGEAMRAGALVVDEAGHD
jgi:hypothetical protein